MKNFKRLAIAGCIVTILSIALLQYAANSRYDALTQKTSLSDDTLSMLPEIPVIPESDENTNSAGPNNSNEKESDTAIANNDLLLKRMPTRKEIFAEFQIGSSHKKPWRHRVNFWFYRGIEPLVQRLSDVEGREVLYHAGMEALSLGDLDTARTYLLEAHELYLNASEPLYRWHNERIADTSMLLAWLEDDPIVAVRLLEKSTSVESIFGSHKSTVAARLAEVTGSEALHIYYRSRSEITP